MKIKMIKISGKDFEISKFPVTQIQYQEIIGIDPSSFRNTHNVSCFNAISTNSPVENVSWFNAIEFCNVLSRRDSLGVVYEGKLERGYAGRFEVDLNKNGYRLPTEVEWKCACGKVPEDLDKFAWYNENSDKTTHPVGLKRHNEYGLYDMFGNVWEWSNDKEGTSKITWAWGNGELGRNQFIQGSCWDSDNSGIQGEYRNSVGPIARSNRLGFRLARSV